MTDRPKNFSFSGFFKLTRVPNLVIIAITQYLTAIFLIGKDSNWTDYFYDYKLAILCFSTILIASAGYIINDYYDVKIDFVNKPKRVVVDKVLKRRIVMTWHTVLNFLGILLGFFVSYKLAIINFLSAGLLWLYSNQLKRLPFIGNLAVASLTAASIAIVGLYYDKNVSIVYAYALFAFALTLIREIIKDIEDMKGDATFGCKTLPIVLGIRKTKTVIYFLIVIFVGLVFFQSNMLNSGLLTNFFVLMIAPIGYFIYRLIIADTKQEFSYLSSYCKILMIAGVLSMIIFKI